MICRVDGPARANRFAHSRENPDSREWFEGSKTEPLQDTRSCAVDLVFIRDKIFCTGDLLLHFQNPNLGLNAEKQILDARTLDPNFWVDFLILFFPAKYLVDVSIFFIFSARGGGRGSPRRQEGGGIGFFFLKSQEGGGGFQRGREGVCSESGNLGGGGAKFFFSGPKRPPRIGPLKNSPSKSKKKIHIASPLQGNLAEFSIGGSPLKPNLELLSDSGSLRHRMPS